MRRLAVVLLLLVACQSETAAEKQQGIDERVCAKFRDIAANADTRTPDELRSDFQDLDERAVIASPPIKQAAHFMLISITAGATDVFADDAQAMSDACDDVGA